MAIFDLQNTLHGYRGFLSKHERKLIMVERIDAINFRRNQYNNNGDFSKGNDYLNSIMENTPLNNINSLAIEHTGNPVEEDDKTEPKANATNVIQLPNELFDRAIRDFYCEPNGYIKDDVLEALEKNDTYVLENALGMESLTITFKKDAQGKITADYEYMPLQVVYPIEGDEVIFSEEDQKNFEEWSQTMLNSRDEKERADAERKLGELLTKYDKKSEVMRGGVKRPKYSEKEIRKFKNGISPGARATIQKIKDLDKMDNTELYIANGKMFNSDDKKAYQQAKDDLEKAKAGIEETLAKENRKPTPDELKILKREIKYINNQEIMDFVNDRKYIFYNDDGVFDSDKYKEFVNYLTMNDGNSSLGDQKDATSVILMNLPTDKDAAKGKQIYEAWQKYQKEGRDAISDEQFELIQKAQNNNIWRKIQAGDNSLQLQMVKAAGGSGQYNYKPILTVASIAASVGLSKLLSAAFSSVNITPAQDPIAEAHVLFNGDELALNENHIAIITQDMLNQNGDNIIIAQAFAKVFGPEVSIVNANIAIPAIVPFGSAPQDGACPAQAKQGTRAHAGLKGSVELGCACDEPQNPTDDNVTVIHDEQGKVEITSCAQEKIEDGCPTVTVEYKVSKASDEEAKKALGDKYVEGAKYNKAKQMWQFYASFDGFEQIKDKKEKQAVMRAIQDQILGGNNALKPGKYDFDNCVVTVNGKDYSFNETKWNNMKEQIYRVDKDAKIKQGGISFTSLKSSSGYAQVVININGEDVRFEANGINKQDAINNVVAKVEQDYPQYAAKVRYQLENCKDCK